MKERLEELMRKEGLSSVRFAELLSVQPSNISHIISGRNKPSYDFILKLSERIPDVNLEWLLTGHGDVYKSNQPGNKGSVTNVNSDNFTNVSRGNADSSSLNETIVNDTHIIDNQNNSNIFDVNSIIPDESNNIMSKKSKIKKIIVLYSDNSFEIYEN